MDYEVSKEAAKCLCDTCKNMGVVAKGFTSEEDLIGCKHETKEGFPCECPTEGGCTGCPKYEPTREAKEQHILNFCNVTNIKEISDADLDKVYALVLEEERLSRLRMKNLQALFSVTCTANPLPDES